MEGHEKFPVLQILVAGRSASLSATGTSSRTVGFSQLSERQESWVEYESWLPTSYIIAFIGPFGEIEICLTFDQWRWVSNAFMDGDYEFQRLFYFFFETEARHYLAKNFDGCNLDK